VLVNEHLQFMAVLSLPHVDAKSSSLRVLCASRCGVQEGLQRWSWTTIGAGGFV